MLAAAYDSPVRSALLLRGINLGPRNRIAMSDLRAAFERGGLAGARTYLQSGNVVVCSELPTQRLEQVAAGLIRSEFGLRIAVIARSRDELESVLRSDPLPAGASDPKRYLVTFLASEPETGTREHLERLAVAGETLALIGRELYSWHPSGIARSKLWNEIAAGVGANSTSRNWNTVTKLFALACE